MDFSARLNEEQCAAATAGDGPMLVLAAAGTGKTRTLVHRVAYLVSQGIDPERILLLTFTNRAAKEMLERASALVDTHQAVIPWSGTFHHVANRLLRRHAPRIGFENGFTILDQDDSRSLMSACVKELKLQSKEFPKRDVLLHVYSQSQNRDISLVDAIDAHFGDHAVDEQQVLRVLKLYQQRKVEIKSMDFDDLLVNCLTLLREHEDLRERYAHQFQHVLVDEYQDTNRIQSQLVDALVGAEGNLFVVGDDFQSIYGWRGADARHILEFQTRYPTARVYKLETNYRSVPEVLNLANVTVDRSGHPAIFHKVLRPTREPYRIPTVAYLRDGEHQASYVVDAIRRFQRDGYRPEEIAVLYRAHFHAMELQVSLTRSRIPHQLTSGIRFFEQAHVKDTMCVLRVLTQPEDAMAFRRMMCLLPGVGEATAERIWKKCGRRVDLGLAEEREIIAQALRPAGRGRWAALAEVIRRYLEESPDGDGARFVQMFVEGFYEKYVFDTYENASIRLEDLTALQGQFDKFESVEQCLQDVALLTNLDTEPDVDQEGERGKVRLSTVHQAKGLEWPVVIILWMNEGMFPSSRALNEADGDDEERRLFYVASTRAKDELILCVPQYRYIRGRGGMRCEVSRYVAELPRGIAESNRSGGYY